MDTPAVLADLLAEQATLDAIMVAVPGEEWDDPSPSSGWTISDQIGHLTYFDRTAAMAISEPDRFADEVERLLAAATDGTDDGVDRLTLTGFRAASPSERLTTWRAHRSDLATAAATLADGDRVSWYGPSMGSRSFLTARLMECWAHGQHVADALGLERRSTDRLRHIAQLGYITKKWTYVNRKLEVPDEDVAVTLTSPTGEIWTFGDSKTNTVTGSALDFCLVVTQCRSASDTGLSIVGPFAADWLDKAQAFAGPATDGPAPGSHP